VAAASSAGDTPCAAVVDATISVVASSSVVVGVACGWRVAVVDTLPARLHSASSADRASTDSRMRTAREALQEQMSSACTDVASSGVVSSSSVDSASTSVSRAAERQRSGAASAQRVRQVVRVDSLPLALALHPSLPGVRAATPPVRTHQPS
jgi:hypothetical protein